MVDHAAMYKTLMGGMLDALEDIEQQNYGFAKLTLVKTLQVAEDICSLGAGEELPAVRLLTPLDPKSTGRRRR
ncbi:hypothetical protein SAMN02745823_03907 [Sporobacter termitidis DSM 10068]|uniref:Uncharacterized protein n=1 Tax=Sporobacter termitidis DSM 10068 TaxID=1123282 RepID=A0A1M5ZLU2_9FIRM|nr:hypothetical protein [Sporobacter termitidis]SHI01695.1 hypothetical protein SAMN02745823_01923 [Sporobacter termitidis DSM 10068]SHI25200.1 hypothetical protein SAMN02745823_03907 [Sporobacter termitidis DSM 10068]